MIRDVYTPRIIVPHDKYVAETCSDSETRLCASAGNKTSLYNVRVVRHWLNKTSLFWFRIIARTPLAFPPGVLACVFLYV